MSNEIRKPVVGDKVRFFPVDGSPSEPGVITQVWTDTCVNIQYDADDGLIGSASSVPLIRANDPGATIPTRGYYCMFADEIDTTTVEIEGLDEDFGYELGNAVVIDVSGETGTIIGRAQYITSENAYLLRYKNALGQAVEDWWKESAISLSH